MGYRSGGPHFIAKIVKELIGFSKELLNLDTELISQHDDKLFRQISSNKQHILKGLLPEKRTRPLRNRSHNFILLYVKTEQFKQCLINRCLFK